MRNFCFDRRIDVASSRERDLVVAMVAGRLIAPASQLGMTQAWADTTLADDFSVADASENDLQAAMDWLIERPGKIEEKPAKRHLTESGLVLFDQTSSSFAGVTCRLAKRGYSRDEKTGTQPSAKGEVTAGSGNALLLNKNRKILGLIFEPMGAGPSAVRQRYQRPDSGSVAILGWAMTEDDSSNCSMSRTCKSGPPRPPSTSLAPGAHLVGR